MSFKLIGGIVTATLLASAAFAQRPAVRTYGSPHGFGHILYPGTGTPPPIRMGPTFPQQLGATVLGRPYAGVRPNPRGVPHHGGGAFVPMPFPIYIGGDGFGYQQPYQQPPVYVVQAPQQVQPPVIINNNYLPETASPVTRRYEDGELPPASGLRSYEAPSPRLSPAPQQGSTIIEDKATIYLIVYKDQSVQPSLAYWVKDDTLHYITLQGTHNRVSLDLVDVPYSEKLNQERNVEFSISKPK